MRTRLSVILLLSVLPIGALAQDPPSCPVGYTCTPKDPYAGTYLGRAETAERERRLCEENRRISEDLAVLGATWAHPRDRGAAVDALDMARNMSRCD